MDKRLIQVNLPGPGPTERITPGGHNEVVAILTQLGGRGWDVAGCVEVSDRMLWTMRRPR